MKKVSALILLLLFTGFLTSTSLNFEGYLKISSAGRTTEDVSSIPEEQQEEKHGNKDKEVFYIAENVLAGHKLIKRLVALCQMFPVPDNIYLEVPHSPPNFG